MNPIIHLDEERQKHYKKVASYSFMDLLLDPEKKKEYDKYCQDTYQEYPEDDFVVKMLGRKK